MIGHLRPASLNTNLTKKFKPEREQQTNNMLGHKKVW